jgi:diguanylate cyclase (GGDEF)-like protein/PAS domain S-box-containing protein
MDVQKSPSPLCTTIGIMDPCCIPLSLLLKKTLLLALPFVIIIGLAIRLYYSEQVVAVENHAQHMNKYAVRDLHLTLQQLLQNIKGDAHLLASHSLLPAVLKNPQGNKAKQLASQWLVFAAQKRIYDQLRLLDLQGQELLRINLTDTGATVVPREQLKNKADRNYFREAVTLPVGQIYLSPLDLNIENGQIEQPIKPMLRVTIPVTDARGDKVGTIILNYLAADIMTRIDSLNRLIEGQALLLNRQGYYLRGFTREQEWRFMYPELEQSDGLFGTHFAEIWQQITHTQQGQMNSEPGLFNYQWISSDGDTGSSTPYTRHFVLISTISADRLAALEAPYRNAAWAALLLALPTILIIAAIAARFRLRELNTFERLRVAEANQRLMLESVGEGIIGLDGDGHLTFANYRAAELTGYQPSEMCGRQVHSLLHSCNENGCNHTLETCPLQLNLRQGVPRRVDNDVFLRKNCDAFPVEYISNPIIKNGELQGGVISFFDITARKDAEQHIEYLVLNDPLTDLPNKKLFIDRLSQQLAASRSTGQLAILLYIDIDRFKQINDGWGYSNGDKILVETAQRLKSISQDGDTIARISSDEFVLLRPDKIADTEQVAHAAQLLADEIMLIMEQPYRLDSYNVRITASIGITLLPLADEDATTVLSHADTAVTSAKEAGRHTTRFFEMEMEHNTRKWLAIHNRLLEAIANDTFSLVYQPKVSQDGRLVGLEALLRWTDRELGYVSPADFIPIAEQSGLIKQISDFVLTSACQQIKEWCDAGLEHVFNHVAINITSEQFSDMDFVDYVLGHIERMGINANNIELEITERTLVDDVATTRDKVLALREHGVRFSIDDFGTGYSSLAYLQQLPLDRLKIDRTFVTDVDKNRDRQTIVEAIILLAKGLGIEVIAEGVENEAEMHFLLRAGCHEFQGYHFYHPLRPDELTNLLQQQASELVEQPVA